MLLHFGAISCCNIAFMLLCLVLKARMEAVAQRKAEQEELQELRQQVT